MHIINWLVGISACECEILPEFFRLLVTWRLSGKRYWSNLSQSFTEKPVETGSLEVQQKTEKLLYRAGKLESDATVKNNVLAKAIQSEIQHISATLQELQLNAKRVSISTQNIEHRTDAIYPLANNTYELVTGIVVEKLNVT